MATAYRMEGAMLVLAALLPSVLKKHKQYRASLEGLAHRYLLPLFASPHAFLRSKGAYLAGQYAAELHFAAEGEAEARRGQGALFDNLFAHVLACLRDTCAPGFPCACQALIQTEFSSCRDRSVSMYASLV